MLKINRYIRDRRGQAIVEMALILPVFIVLLLGMLYSGLVLQDYITLTEAARAGARVAAVGGNDTAVITAIDKAAPNILPARLTTTIVGNAAGSSVVVTVSNPMNFFVWNITSKDELEQTSSAPFNVTATAEMRIEVAR